MEKGTKEATKLVMGTLVIAVISYYVVSWEFLRTILTAFPEIVFGFLIINFFIGKWTGMKAIEYIRFKEVFKHAK